MDRTDPEHPQLIGLACAHVDDFLFGGESDHRKWQEAISTVYDSYKWSDWEVDCYQHCGVSLTQQVNGNITLSQADYCTSIEQIKVQAKDQHRKITDEEKQQLRGVLGALQWRVYQTAPQHGARLSALQSQLACPTVNTLLEANKLVKEVYAQRHMNVQYRKLDVKSLEDITFIAWTDAAVGNRRDLSSSGGYVIGATEPKDRRWRSKPSQPGELESRTTTSCCPQFIVGRDPSIFYSRRRTYVCPTAVVGDDWCRHTNA